MPTLTLESETAFAFTNLINTLGAIYFCLAIVGTVTLLVIRFTNLFPNAKRFLTSHATHSAFGVALIALLGSLTYSNVIGFPPCDLCWMQRIFLYPQVFILAVALRKKELNILAYTKVLSVIGLIFSVWHNFVYYGGSSPFPCSATASCTAHYVEVINGLVTIPSMALVSFILLLTLSCFNKKESTHK